MRRLLPARVKLAILGSVSGILLAAGCLPSNFASDLAATTISAIWGDTLYTILDYVLPRPPA